MPHNHAHRTLKRRADAMTPPDESSCNSKRPRISVLSAGPSKDVKQEPSQDSLDVKPQRTRTAKEDLEPPSCNTPTRSDMPPARCPPVKSQANQIEDEDLRRCQFCVKSNRAQCTQVQPAGACQACRRKKRKCSRVKPAPRPGPGR